MGLFRPDGRSERQCPDGLPAANVIPLSDRRKPSTGLLEWKPSLHALEIADTGGLGRYLVRKHHAKLAVLHNGVLLGTFDTVAEAKARAELGYQELLAKQTEAETDYALAA